MHWVYDRVGEHPVDFYRLSSLIINYYEPIFPSLVVQFVSAMHSLGGDSQE